jgi:hypothetical protein
MATILNKKPDSYVGRSLGIFNPLGTGFVRIWRLPQSTVALQKT